MSINTFKPVANSSLMLHVDNIAWRPKNIAQVALSLQHIGLIEQAIPGRDTAFYSGKKFLEYITYMGCAPHVEFRPTESSQTFCYIQLHSVSHATLIHSPKQARAPHCPGCGKPEKNWQQSLVADETKIHCSHCHKAQPIEHYQWRKSAGMASFFIEITDIFPREAIPQKELLKALEALYQGNWQYFYYCT